MYLYAQKTIKSVYLFINNNNNNIMSTFFYHNIFILVSFDTKSRISEAY